VRDVPRVGMGVVERVEGGLPGVAGYGGIERRGSEMKYKEKLKREKEIMMWTEYKNAPIKQSQAVL
jgi:hypothetical protein